MTERTGGDFDTKSEQWLHERQTLGQGTTADPAAQQNDAKNNDGTDKKGKDDE